MDRITEIFDQDTQTDQSAEDFDADLATSAAVLTKLAAEEGVDLNALSDADIADLMGELLPQQANPQTHIETRKEASAMSNENETQTVVPSEVTYADVAVELSKIAAEEGIDLATASREEYHEAFSALAERMSDPAYGQAKIAEEEKLAEAYAQGQRMADGFLDRIKEAGDDDEDEEEKKKREAKEKEGKKEAAGAMAAGLHHAKEKAKKMLGKGVGMAHRAGERASAAGHSAAHAASSAERKGHERLGKGAPSGLTNAVAKRMHGAAHERLGKARTAVGRAMTGGAAAAIGGAGAAGHAAGRSKESLDQAAEQLAIELARDMGYDPTSGQKVASDETVTEETVIIADGWTADEVAEAAVTMLKEAGYPVE